MPYRVLFVDDDPDPMDVIEMCLKVNGFEVRNTVSTPDALRIAREERFDAYLFDSWMQEMTSVELRSASGSLIHPLQSSFIQVPAREVDRGEAQSAGATCYMAKPVDLDRLVATLRSLVEKNARRKRLARQEKK